MDLVAAPIHRRRRGPPLPNDLEPTADLPGGADRTDDDVVVVSEPLQRIRVAAAARATLLRSDRARLDLDLDRLRSKAGA